MDDTISLLQGIPFQSHNLYVTFSKQVKWRLSYTIMDYAYFDKSKWKHGGYGGGGGGVGGGGAYFGDSIVLEFRGFMFLFGFGISDGALVRHVNCL